MPNVSKIDLFREKKLSQYTPSAGRLPVQTGPAESLIVEELLEGILLELKKITLHLSMMTDERITEEDI